MRVFNPAAEMSSEFWGLEALKDTKVSKETKLKEDKARLWVTRQRRS
jgi:hypothetical protein